MTPKILQKMVWAGSNLGSYAMAEEAMRELAGVSVSLRRIRRVVGQVGNERVAERDAAVARLQEMDLPKQQIGSTAVDPPQIAVTAMDGGRYQRRDHFGEKDRPAREKHWREDKVGCLLSMSGARYESEVSPTDPRKRVDRALTYYEYHRSRMNYPEYRRLGLPLTSSHIESTIKQINRRVKGTEKFWSPLTSEAVLQLRADYLSDSAPLVPFWLRHQIRQTGANAYIQAT